MAPTQREGSTDAGLNPSSRHPCTLSLGKVAAGAKTVSALAHLLWRVQGQTKLLSSGAALHAKSSDYHTAPTASHKKTAWELAKDEGLLKLGGYRTVGIPIQPYSW